MGFPKLNGSSRVAAIFGYPVEHSFSPAMHNAAYQELGLNWVYVPFSVHPTELPRAVEAIRTLGMAGVNITVPHKQAVIPLLDEIDPTARLIGAVNTIENRHGRLVGYNTDGRGFIQSLTNEVMFTPQNKTALVLGAGGAARAVVVQLALSGISKLYLSNRSTEKADCLAKVIRENTSVTVEVIPWGVDLLSDVADNVDLVIQTTPIGMAPATDLCPEFPYGRLRSGQLVCDLIYNPAQTLFLKRAAMQGSTTLNGLGMLLYQGVLAFEQWTGQQAPVEVMREALLRQVQ